jgi:F0F1-type ATP synthase assembly protein I
MKGWSAWSQAMQLSWTLLFSLVLPLLVGIWLDKKLNTVPLFILIGTVLGVLAATVGVARIAIRMFSHAVGGDADSQAGEDGEEETE